MAVTTKITTPGRESWPICPLAHSTTQLDQGSYRQFPMDQNFMQLSAPTAMSAKTVSRPRTNRGQPCSEVESCDRQVGAYSRRGPSHNPNGPSWQPPERRRPVGLSSMSATKLGNDLVPDYMTSVNGLAASMAWPYSYFRSAHVDDRVSPQRARTGGEGDSAGITPLGRTTPLHLGLTCQHRQSGFRRRWAGWRLHRAAPALGIASPRAGYQGDLRCRFADGNKPGRQGRRDVLTGSLTTTRAEAAGTAGSASRLDTTGRAAWWPTIVGDNRVARDARRSACGVAR